MLDKIDELVKKINEHEPLDNEKLKEVRDKFIIEFTYNSNAIEGSEITLNETALIINEGVTIPGQSLKDHLEVIGHQEACLYMLELLEKNMFITEDNIKAIHNIILMDKLSDRGVYRKTDVEIEGASNLPPQSHLIEDKMKQLIVEYNEMKTKNIIEQVSLFHLKFEGIHPFIDGNGRTGRLLLNLELMRNGFPPINIKFEDRLKYYECFNKYYKEDGNTNCMIEFISKYVIEALEERINILNK